MRLCRLFTPFLILLSLSFSLPLYAQDDDDHFLEEIIVSGVRATQGGAQDIDYFRGEVEQSRVPHPDTITAEGLLSNHDLVIPAGSPCEQIFCLTADYMPADLVAVPDAEILIGLGFDTVLSQTGWEPPPLNLVAVVDKSGSMDGQPLNVVKQALQGLVDNMREGDQISIVLYGSQTHQFLQPTKINDNKGSIKSRIKEIESSGSTFMEAGLKMGYETARATSSQFEGNTRVMLFTDERPNVGRTDAESFMELAISASNDGIGLTTIGVGQQFGAALAQKISSVRGGNLFFLQSEEDATDLFGGNLDFMVAELAHDLKITISPDEAYSISGIYGVPGELLGWQSEREVNITIPTVFLSKKGGGIFFSLAKRLEQTHLPSPSLEQGDVLAEVSLSYNTREDKKEGHSVKVDYRDSTPSQGMQLGHLLVDQFTSLHRAVTEHYLNNDQERAYQLLKTMLQKLVAADRDGLEQEVELVSALEQRFAFLSGNQSEAHERKPQIALWGSWEITRTKGNVSLRRGEYMSFNPAGEFFVHKQKDDQMVRTEFEDYISNDDQFYLSDSEITFEYDVDGDSMRLRHKRAGVRVWLQRMAEPVWRRDQ